jgi:hypothetical protein
MKTLALYFSLLPLLLALAGQARALEQEPEAIAVRPSGDTVPENLLRISIVFDRPTADSVLPGLRLRRSDGAEIERPFLDEELWSPDGRILTVLFNPGRVKTGIYLHERYGRALHAGEQVELTFRGRVIKKWQVLPPETRRIDPAQWRLASPRSGTREALIVSMRNHPIDAMEADTLAVLDLSGNPLRGRSAVLAGESVWTFTPATAWEAGRYVLIVPPGLEDPVGNTMAAPFEMSSPRAARSNAPLVLSFVVREATPESQRDTGHKAEGGVEVGEHERLGDGVAALRFVSAGKACKGRGAVMNSSLLRNDRSQSGRDCKECRKTRRPRAVTATSEIHGGGILS